MAHPDQPEKKENCPNCGQALPGWALEHECSSPQDSVHISADAPKEMGEAQASICPNCHDDHGTDENCLDYASRRIRCLQDLLNSARQERDAYKTMSEDIKRQFDRLVEVHEKELSALKEEVGILKSAMKSISLNTCCDGCQEAKKVALKALAAYAKAEGGKECRHHMPLDWNCNACSDSGNDPRKASI